MATYLICMYLRRSDPDGFGLIFGLICGAIFFVFWLVSLLTRQGDSANSAHSSATRFYPEATRREFEHRVNPRDQAFDDAFSAQFADKAESFFHCKLAGVTHDNSDGSSRDTIIRRCKIGEPLELRLEPENPVDLNAVAVYRLIGRKGQVGYLPATVAAEIAPVLRVDSGKCIAWFIRLLHRRRPRVIVGAMIVVGHLKESFDYEAAKKPPKKPK